MDAQQIQQFCLSFPGAYADHPFGEDTTVFKVATGSTNGTGATGKMFAMLLFSDTRINLKCDPSVGPGLRAEHSAITPGYHMSKKHWITVDFAALDDEFARELVEDSYDLVVNGLPRRIQEKLKWKGLSARES
ncbi:MmcQ/YjbR family DNA-binding protein [Neomicrococcus lactis]|uniref:MmcQ/YjbR family DNA-binding protein n=1 Tax=Neomicrococcus lactis TaxID=732241 RepID=UPI00230037FD|nr:MmcQ/YjbR family DNA-binding protein [Neomicrococcus lactis]